MFAENTILNMYYALRSILNIYLLTTTKVHYKI